MTKQPEVRIGIIGYGMMGKAHSYGYREAPRLRELPVRPRLQVISGRRRELVEKAAAAYGVEEVTTDWRKIIERKDIDIVDICTPPGTHAEIAATAAAAGKAVFTEKPFAIDYADGKKAVDAAQRAGVLNAVGFNYRRLPAVSLMKRMIDEGAVGKVQLWRGCWLSDEFVDPQIPFDWRFERKMGGTTIADLGSHMIDMALWMVGEVSEVSAQSATFVPERANPEKPGAKRSVEIDDASSALMNFANGCRGVLEMARTCVRRPCDFTVEVNGTKGTLRFDYARLNELLYGDAGDAANLYGMRRIRAEHPTHPYAANWWPIGQGVGYGSSFVNQFADLLEAWPKGPWDPDFRQGLAVQGVCDAIERAAAERRWVKVSEITSA
ncbi:MAG TPA: Gfo/Idh/MocA family oxidoreductase [Dongiaceae bacterium]|nr:Gfo/Idh/MocA family oxidoreductase [Dongiaceae bacterium]